MKVGTQKVGRSWNAERGSRKAEGWEGPVGLAAADKLSACSRKLSELRLPL